MASPLWRRHFDSAGILILVAVLVVVLILAAVLIGVLILAAVLVVILIAHK